MTELLDAVDALTLPTRTKVPQWVTRDGVEVQTVTVIEHDPLLKQLEDAIASTIGAGAGRAMVERRALNVLDSDALYQFSVIASQVGDWCRIVGVKPTRHPTKDLRAWYAARLATQTESDDWYVNTLHGWARMIQAKLNPWASWEVTDPCPKCHASTWEDEVVDLNDRVVKVERNRPILVEYPPGGDVLAQGRATCRRCGNEWKGSSALRELRWDIDHVGEPVGSE